jgi:hypothetical protein
MSHEISRMFATAEDARNAAAELAEEGFDEVYVVTPPTKEDAPVSAIAKGGSLVTVHAPFGSGMKATVILDSHKPIPSGMPEPVREPVWDEAAPFSSAMHMPLLTDDPAPMSRYLGVQPLAGSDCSLSGMIGMPLLSNNPMPLSSLFGMTSLSDKAAPLSSLIGLPLLKEGKRKGR